MRGDDMSITGSAHVKHDAMPDELALEDLDASSGLYESGPDDAVVVRYYSDEALFASMQRGDASSDSQL